MKRPRRNHGAGFNATGALAAIKGDQTVAELAEHFAVHQTPITEWTQQLLARAADGFGGPTPKADQSALKDLHATSGQLTLENDFVEGALTKAGLLSARR